MEDALLHELSARFGVGTARLRVALEAADDLSKLEITLMSRLIALIRRHEPAERDALAEDWAAALALRDSEQPSLWDTVDGHLSPDQARLETLRASQAVRENRRSLLRDCVDVSEASRLSGRSRQAIERRRRSGKVLALQANNKWRYPKWQFDLDEPNGMVPGVQVVLRLLHLSPPATAWWFTHEHDALGGAPIRILTERREVDRVLALAQAHGVPL